MPSPLFPPFQIFGVAHLLTLLFTGLASWGAIRYARSQPSSGSISRLSWTLGILLLLTWPAKIWGYYAADPTYPTPLPMHMCDWAAFLCVGAMWLRKQWMAELAYFWGVGGTFQGLVTPNLAYGFPHPMYLSFFMLHSGVVIAAIYTVLGLGMRPRRNSFLLAWAALHVYMVVAIAVNAITGENFGFLRAKPDAGSLFDLLGPWPWYILALEPVVLLIFGLLYLPFLRENLRRN